jgi:hypothetical protein
MTITKRWAAVRSISPWPATRDTKLSSKRSGHALRIAKSLTAQAWADVEFANAYATLLRAAAFVTARAHLAHQVGPEPYRAKMIGNALRELDRFLNLLADETTRLLGLPLSPGQKNTANKLGEIDALRLSWGDYQRLRALGRSREILYHCDGRIARGDRPGVARFTTGWQVRDGCDAPLREIAAGTVLTVTDDDLRDAAAFYQRLGLDLACAVMRR